MQRMIEMYENSVEMLLEKTGFKKTVGRKAILKVLGEADRPLTRQEISERLPAGVNVNFASIYRAMEAFLKVGLIHRVEAGDRAGRYALCGCGTRGHCHPHFICNSCGRAECLMDINLPRPAGVRDGYVVQGQEYYLRGLCSKCSSE